ncbi:hypothetical protein OCAE111667_26320 [Occultella aeris]|uniref:Uncharacterized protein n=1 Tax=Occultella aeris TaxID=2761496 RepID=A0A7M4DNI8_9MICO|nr:hypothetical protein HALOF300_03718 [Occultella aeris]
MHGERIVIDLRGPLARTSLTPRLRGIVLAFGLIWLLRDLTRRQLFRIGVRVLVGVVAVVGRTLPFLVHATHDPTAAHSSPPLRRRISLLCEDGHRVYQMRTSANRNTMSV